MKLKINGNIREVPGDKITIEELFKVLEIPGENKIVVLNLEVIPEDEWKKKILNEKDEVEILNMVGGG